MKPLLQNDRLVAANRAMVLAAIMWALVPGVGMAQEVEPLGLRAGSVLLHPGAFVESGYDSNLFYEDPSELAPGESLTTSFVLKPGLSLRAETPAPTVAEWEANVRGTWEQYLSGAERVSNNSGIEVSAATSLLLWPTQTFKMKPNFLYALSNGPADQASNVSLDNHLVSPGIEALIEPEDGKIFGQTFGYQLRLRIFDGISDIDSQNHHLSSITRWSFLPQTAVTLRIEQDILTYSNATRSLPAPLDLANNGATPFRAQAGLRGLLFNRLNVNLQAGYAYTFYDAGANEHLFIAQGELGYEWTEATRLTFGYIKNFEDSTFGNYFKFHRLYLKFQTEFANRFDASLGGHINFDDFGAIEDLSGRSDSVYDVDAALGYTFVPGLTARLAYLLRGNSSDFGSQVGGQPVGSASYVKHQALLNLAYEF